MSQAIEKPGLLLTANYDSDVGYAWWLMESFWAALAHHYSTVANVHLAYPSISKVPEMIAQAPITLHTCDFDDRAQSDRQQSIIEQHNIKSMYLSDRPLISTNYARWRRQGVRTIMVHDHAPGMRSQPTPLKLAIKKLLHRLPFVVVDAAFGASHFVTERHIHINGMPKSRCFAAPNGLEQSNATQAADCHALFGIPNDRKIIITTGRIQRYKNLDFALQLMAKLKSQRNDFHYLLCGDGPDRDMFERQATELGLNEHVTFAGRRDDIPQLLLGADIGFQPSKGEVGYSLSILEYMQAGLPVLVSNNPSVCEATSHSEDGLIYAEDNLADAASKLATLLDDPAMTQTLGQNAQQKIRDHYQLAHTHAAIIQGAQAVDPILQSNTNKGAAS